MGKYINFKSLVLVLFLFAIFCNFFNKALIADAHVVHLHAILYDKPNSRFKIIDYDISHLDKNQQFKEHAKIYTVLNLDEQSRLTSYYHTSLKPDKNKIYLKSKNRYTKSTTRLKYGVDEIDLYKYNHRKAIFPRIHSDKVTVRLQINKYGHARILSLF